MEGKILDTFDLYLGICMEKTEKYQYITLWHPSQSWGWNEVVIETEAGRAYITIYVNFCLHLRLNFVSRKRLWRKLGRKWSNHFTFAQSYRIELHHQKRYSGHIFSYFLNYFPSTLRSLNLSLPVSLYENKSTRHWRYCTPLLLRTSAVYTVVFPENYHTAIYLPRSDEVNYGKD